MWTVRAHSPEQQDCPEDGEAADAEAEDAVEVGPHELALGLHLKIVRSTVTWARVVMVVVKIFSLSVNS